MKRSFFVFAWALASGTVVSWEAWAADISAPAPLTFQATRSGKTNYNLNWNMRLAESVPVRTGLKVGLAAAPDGRVANLPLRVTAGLGDLDEATETIRRSVELSAGQEASNGDASVTMRRARPLAITPGLDAELRQALTTGLRAGSSRAMGEVKASQTLVMNEIAPRTSLRATTSLSSGQKGVSAGLKIERKLLKSFSVSADFSHDAKTNNARIDARYALNW